MSNSRYIFFFKTFFVNETKSQISRFKTFFVNETKNHIFRFETFFVNKKKVFVRLRSYLLRSLFENIVLES